MSVHWVRRYCLSLPHTTEKVQWGNDLVFKVGEKMYALVALEPAGVWLCFKCSPEDFADLTERPGVIPAPYLARARWVALENEDALPVEETKRMLKRAYETVFARLPEKTKARFQHAGRASGRKKD